MKTKKIERKEEKYIYVLMIVKNLYIICLKFTFININNVYKNNNLNKYQWLKY